LGWGVVALSTEITIGGGGSTGSVLTSISAMSKAGLEAAVKKMQAGGVHQTAIDVFVHYYQQLESGATGLIPESEIEPLSDPPRLADLGRDSAAEDRALAETVVIKLNGGLGTSMGMDRAKSLLKVHDDLTFLDLIVRQVLLERERTNARLPLMFMNSFRTSDDTLDALSAYPDVQVSDLPLDFIQNREPKLRSDDLTPVVWPDDPTLEWCPPGHGDLYTALSVSGVLDKLLDAGFGYAFVSNSDNLGATADPRVAGWFASSGAPFACEVCRRTPADRKGGHLAVRRHDGQLVLRETAQTAPEDLEALADIGRHPYCNTNNLWLDLRALADTLSATGGVLGLPLIRNAKTVDPADSSSPEVVQIETAMGAAVEVFTGSMALHVERDRFLPVKSTNDLLVMRSDAYERKPDASLRLAGRRSDAPLVDLDSQYYKLIADFDRRFPAGPPSLVQADELNVRGDWTFGRDVVVRGNARVEADGAPGTIPDGAVLEG
jgi:UTP--glucose-1-phosphate uridylyltransferase